MRYAEKLDGMGIAATRIPELVTAMEMLHSALCKLDNTNLNNYMRTGGILHHLDTFAECTGDRNIAREVYKSKLREAAKRIDFDEFADFSDKLFYLTEQAHEVGIPGAQMLCKSLCDLRKSYELKRMLFSRLAQQAENISQVNGVIDRDSLKIRITSKYKDAFRHLDEERYIGTVETLRSVERNIDEEHGESGSNLLFIRVTLDPDRHEAVSTEDVRKAIQNTYSYHGCGHEHDCCGCISQSVNRMKKLRTNGFFDNEIWVVSVSWYRNV